MCFGAAHSSARTVEEVDALAARTDAYQGNLKVIVRETPAQTVVELAGELDLATVETLREAALRLELDDGIDLAVDLRGLSFLGSTGIGMLVTLRKRVRASGGHFSVLCDQDMARRTLEIAGLVDYLEIHDGEESDPNQRSDSFDSDGHSDELTGVREFGRPR